jgi:Ca2+-binding EF-hand superfamily protein
MLLTIAAACAQAQPDQAFIRNFRLLQALDTDHDGVISAAEIAAAPKSLLTLDQDEDGKLTAEECAEEGAQGPTPSELVKSLMAFDKNGDGKLQRDEVPERMRGLFDRGDTNKDGVLTIDQIRAMAKADLAARPKEQEGNPKQRHRTEIMIMRVIPVLAAMDTDHDAVLSASEIANAAAALKTLDKNGDGQLTDDEVSPDWVRVLVAQIMIQFDSDEDNRLSPVEIAALMANPKAAQLRGTLEAADRNHDGYITEDELIEEVRLRADINHDGVVTEQEIQQAMQSGALAKAAVTDKPSEEVHKK